MKLIPTLARHLSKEVKLIGERFRDDYAKKLVEKLRRDYEAIGSVNVKTIDSRRPKRKFKGIVTIQALKRINCEVADEIIENLYL